MNKLADEQNTRMTTAEQNGTDFYARITPGYISARHQRRTGRHDLFASAISLIGERHGKFELVELVNALLFDIESSERRAEELQDELADVYALLPGYHYMDPPDGGDVSPLEQMRRLAEDAKAHRKTITNGNISEDRKTLASGDMPPGGASE